MKRIPKNPFKESDMARLNNLATRHGLSIKRSGMVYRFEDFTAYGLGQALGYAEGFDRAIAVTQSAIEEFRKRAAQIDAEAKRLGVTSPTARAELGTKTRHPKRSPLVHEAERQSRLVGCQAEEVDALAFIVNVADVGEEP